ncbi:MAG: FAD-dependent oxidoreductase [Bacteroidetes bacterium]|nr:FAD-dependent oxidoreductase [Bacteroidota bacterium]
MPDTRTVPAYNVPVRHSPDVCVIGAGPAGLSAAIAASRLGLSVLLIEKYGFCGGATVAGLSGTICGLFSSGKWPTQIVFGFADEFYSALRVRKGVTLPVEFGRTLLVPHDSLVWKETADDLLEASGCKISYHTQFIKAFEEDGRISWLLLKDPGGQFAVKPRFVIDASGDAEVVHSLSLPTSFGKDGQVQTPTMIFKMGGVDMRAFLAMDPAEINTLVRKAHDSGAYRLPRHHVYLFPLPNMGEVLCNMTRITFPDGSVPIGTCAEDLTYAEIEGRRQAREYARFLKEQVKAFCYSYMVETGTQIGIRQTRSIRGKGLLTNDAVINAKKDKNAVAHSAWPIELHQSEKVHIHYLENDFYDIPFETLIPKDAVNLLVAGRCMSAEHEALASARVTAQCFGMGYGAGAASGLSLLENIPAHAISGRQLRDWMKEHNLKNTNEK